MGRLFWICSRDQTESQRSFEVGEGDRSESESGVSVKEKQWRVRRFQHAVAASEEWAEEWGQQPRNAGKFQELHKARK